RRAQGAARPRAAHRGRIHRSSRGRTRTDGRRAARADCASHRARPDRGTRGATVSRRADGRAPDELRPVTIAPHWTKHAEGAALIQTGDTWVLCTASVEDRVPAFLHGKGRGWVTAEYGMLPRSTSTRSGREPGGRGKEIQRLIGRALRAGVDLAQLGERSITV